MVSEMLPMELLGKIYLNLNWRDSRSVCVVCKKFNLAYRLADAPDWHQVVGSGESAKAATAALVLPVQIRFPHVVLVNVMETAPLVRGSYKGLLQQLSEDLESFFNLNTIVVYTLCLEGSICVEEFHGGHLENDRQVVISMSFIHLPDTKVRLITPERRAIRRAFDELYPEGVSKHLDRESIDKAIAKVLYENGNKSNVEIGSDYIVLSSSISCGRKLANMIELENPKATIVGGILPYTDRAQPIGVWNGTFTDEMTAVLEISGSCGIQTVGSHGYVPCTDFLQCHEVDAGGGGRHIATEPLYFYRGVTTCQGEKLSISQVLHDFLHNYDDLHREHQHEKPLYAVQGSREYLNSMQLQHHSFDALYISSGFDSFCSKTQWNNNLLGRLYTIGKDAGYNDYSESLAHATNLLQHQHNVFGAIVFNPKFRAAIIFHEDQSEIKLLRKTIRNDNIFGYICSDVIGPSLGTGGYKSSLPPVTDVQFCSNITGIFYQKSKKRREHFVSIETQREATFGNSRICMDNTPWTGCNPIVQFAIINAKE